MPLQEMVQQEDWPVNNGNTTQQEVVFMHDTGFGVKICTPGCEPFDIQVSRLVGTMWSFVTPCPLSTKKSKLNVSSFQ